MSEQQKKTGTIKRSLRLFLVILLVLLVPVTMDQSGVDAETVRTVGRVAGGLTLLMIAYGVFAKLLKVMAFVLIVLLTLVVLMSERQLEFPRLKDLIGSAQEQK